MNIYMIGSAQAASGRWPAIMSEQIRFGGIRRYAQAVGEKVTSTATVRSGTTPLKATSR